MTVAAVCCIARLCRLQASSCLDGDSMLTMFVEGFGCGSFLFITKWMKSLASLSSRITNSCSAFSTFTPFTLNIRSPILCLEIILVSVRMIEWFLNKS